jgi:hypothetical protein
MAASGEPTSEPTTRSIGDVLHGDNPSPEELVSLKRWAKIRRADSGSGLHADVFRVIYFAAIAKALRAAQTISDLPAQELKRGCEWAAQLPWVEPRLAEQLGQVK